MSSVAKVVGGTVAAGTGTGVAGYGTYRYLTYETLGDLIARENEGLQLLSRDSTEDEWSKSATRYLVELTESKESTSPENPLDGVEKIIGTDSEEKLKEKKGEFKKKCLEALESEIKEENKSKYENKIKTWCIKFESFGDKLNKKLDLEGTGWETKYDTLTTEGQNSALKALLEAKKGSFTSGEDNTKKADTAKWWCKLAINKKYKSDGDSEYTSFQSKCLLKEGA